MEGGKSLTLTHSRKRTHWECTLLKSERVRRRSRHRWDVVGLECEQPEFVTATWATCCRTPPPTPSTPRPPTPGGVSEGCRAGGDGGAAPLPELWTRSGSASLHSHTAQLEKTALQKKKKKGYRWGGGGVGGGGGGVGGLG